MASPNIEEFKQVVILGAGVVGLTTALRIQERGGYQVTIIADILPTDPKSIKYTSHWAGAHHVLNVTEDDRQQKMDLDTFNVMWELSKPGGEAEKCFLRLPQTEYYRDMCFKPPLEVMPDYKEHAKDTLPPEVEHGSTFSTVTIDTPKYLPYLASRFLASGGTMIRGSVQHINEVVEGGARIFTARGKQAVPPDAIVVCTGLGTRTLGGVEDQTVYPIRGQAVLINAPWVRFGRTMVDKDGTWTYIIPRRSGDVIVGGTKGVDDWYPVPRPEITRDILGRAFAICPELASPEVRNQRAPTLEDILPLVIEEGCGLRPARKDGIRLETEWFAAGKSDIKVPVIYNYGHGGYGFQSSWGSADIALRLLEEAIGSTARAP
ncbi:D-amino-acid oxidase [Collybia nuda]|uniref:D-amino-acid oxidase n=1 Tax=Collybia nuda TaxID=64659 RepID=A0A9P5XUM2_9AGAR|nr:D-amino-acid oxidase [Collybia nuda]